MKNKKVIITKISKNKASEKYTVSIIRITG